MLNKTTLKSAIKSAVKNNIGYKQTTVDTPNMVKSGEELVAGTPIKVNKETPFPAAVVENIAEAVAEAVSASVIDALSTGLTMEGLITELTAVHSGALIGVGGGIPGPVTITSGVVKSSVGKIKVTLGKIT